MDSLNNLRSNNKEGIVLLIAETYLESYLYLSKIGAILTITFVTLVFGFLPSL